MNRFLRVRSVALAATLATMALLAGAVPSQAAPEDFALETLIAELSSDQAGGHPDFDTTIGVNQDPDSESNVFGLKEPYAYTRDVVVELPPGMSGNLNVVEHCTAVQLIESLGVANETTSVDGCPNASQVGVTRILAYGLTDDFLEPVYMMEPPGGDVVARLGFVAGIFPTYIDIRLDPARDYALTARVSNASSVARLVQAETTIWGVPADPVHDTERQTPGEALTAGASSSVPRPPGGPRLAFMSNPGRCGDADELRALVSSWERPDVFSSLSVGLPVFTGCERVQFSPDIVFRPTTRRADAASGIDVQLRLGQDTITNPDAPAAAHLKKTLVTMPEGLAMNPSAADGLGACSTAQIGLVSKAPIRFNAEPVRCPDSSKVGTARITTPVLPDPVEGALYLADPNDNPFDTLLSGYLVAEGQGVRVKIPGRFDPDPQTGRIVATFDNNPQLPFSVADLHFKGGSRGVIATPGCGSHPVRSVFTSWAAPERELVRESALVFDEGCGGRPFEFDFAAGSADPVAGAPSPFAMSLSREGGTQVFKGVQVTLPPGLLAKVAGVPKCPEPQAAVGTCGEESKIGRIVAASGAGETPLWIPQPGKDPTRVYFAGPYKGAPFSLSVVVPAQAGPFDLGNVVVRVALHVDPTTAQVTAVSDPLPHILRGIPLNVRAMHVVVDRPDFTRNATSCRELSVAGVFRSLEGSTKEASSRYRAGGCRALDFKPKLKMRLTGRRQTREGRHPGLKASLTQTDGEAGIRRAEVRLPLSLALDPYRAQSDDLCEFEDGIKVDLEHHCPASSIIGRAKAVSPLLNEPLSGPVYFVKNVRIHPRTGRRIRTLPMLIVALRGEVAINVKGESSVVDNKLTTTFASVPDAPISRFGMNIHGGKRGILVVTRKNVCGRQIAEADFDGHNNKIRDRNVRIKTPCKTKQRCNTRKQKRTRACKQKAKRTKTANRRAAQRRAGARSE